MPRRNPALPRHRPRPVMIVPILMTVKEAADDLGITPSAVRKRAKRMGLAKHGTNFVIFPAQVEQMRIALANEHKRGRKVNLKGLL